MGSMEEAIGLMAEIGLNDEAAAAAADVNGAPAAQGPSPDEPVPMGGGVNLSGRDLMRARKELKKRLAQEKPWAAGELAAAAAVGDMGWHKPGCTLEKWPHKEVAVELAPGIARVTLCSPAAGNALSPGVVAGLCDAMALLHGRHDIRVAVFSGQGADMLCRGRAAGADGAEGDGGRFGFGVQPGRWARDEADAEVEDAVRGGAFPGGSADADIGRLLQTRFWQAWAALPQFTICLANGSAFDDGLGCLLCSDAAVSVRGASFGFRGTKQGLVKAGLSPFLLGKVRAGTAKNMLMFGEVITAEQGLQRGLLNRVVDTIEDGAAAVAELCAEVTRCAPGSVRLTKQVVQGVTGRQVDESVMFYAMAMAAKCDASDDAAAAAAALGEGKPMPWEAQLISAAAAA